MKSFQSAAKVLPKHPVIPHALLCCRQHDLAYPAMRFLPPCSIGSCMHMQEFETELKNATEEGKDAVNEEKEKLQR